MKRSTALLAPGVIFLAVLLGGCAALPGGGPAPLDTFELSAPAMKFRNRQRTQLLITEPAALKALDGQNIVVRPTPNAIEYLKGAQWADRLPRLVQARLVETFQRSGAFGGVGRPGEGLAIDYQLIIDIRKFEISAGAQPVAQIELFARLLNDRNGVVRASRIFAAQSPVSGAGNGAYVGALDRAFGEVVSAIAAWSANAI